MYLYSSWFGVFFLHFVIVTLTIIEKCLSVPGLCIKAGEVLFLYLRRNCQE